MRKNSLICILLFVSFTSNAQFYKSFLPSQAFTDSLHKIVASFQNNYYPIQGNALGAQADVDTYESIATVPGAAKTMLYRFHSVIDTTASWQAVMYSGDSFKEAAKIYKNIFRYVNKAHFKIDDFNFGFSGNMEEPTESLRFSVSTLKAVSDNPAFEHFIAEVEITNSFAGWEVHLNLENKKDDQDKY